MVRSIRSTLFNSIDSQRIIVGATLVVVLSLAWIVVRAGTHQGYPYIPFAA